MVLRKGFHSWEEDLGWRGGLRRELQPRERMRPERGPKPWESVESGGGNGVLGVLGRDHILGRRPEPWRAG